MANESSRTSFKGKAPQSLPAFLVCLLVFLFLFPSLYYLPQAPGVAGISRFLTTIYSCRLHLAVSEGDSKRICIQMLPLTCHGLWVSYPWAPGLPFINSDRLCPPSHTGTEALLIQSCSPSLPWTKIKDMSEVLSDAQGLKSFLGNACGSHVLCQGTEKALGKFLLRNSHGDGGPL